jgi:hypothetical protein
LWAENRYLSKKVLPHLVGRNAPICNVSSAEWKSQFDWQRQSRGVNKNATLISMITGKPADVTIAQ